MIEEFTDVALLVKGDEFTQGIATQWGAKSSINHFNKMVPRRCPRVVLQSMIPQLHRTGHVEHGQPYLFLLHRVLTMEELVTSV